MVSLHDWLQIEQAACGCISGTLREWPDLRRALVKLGWSVKRGTPATELTALCRQIMARRGRIEITDGDRLS